MKHVNKTCEQCGIDVTKEYGSGRFCTSFCARKFSTAANRQAINLKIKNKMLAKIDNGEVFGFVKINVGRPKVVRTEKPKIEQSQIQQIQQIQQKPKTPRVSSLLNKVCPICNVGFQTWPSSNNTFCSKKCMNNDVNFLYKKKAAGGARPNSGHSKPGYFRGIWCQSSYELVYAIYNLDHNIDFKRNTVKYAYVFNGEEHEYLPDFLEGDTVIEVKGYKDEKVEAKAASVNGKYRILYKKDLKYAFNYVLEKYGKKPENVVEMYDQYRPTYNYVCGVCGKEFGVERKRRTKNTYCSQSCAGKHVGGTYVKEKLQNI